MKQVVSLTRMASTKLAEISKQAQKPYIRILNLRHIFPVRLFESFQLKMKFKFH